MRWKQPPDSAFINGCWARYAHAFGEHVQLGFDAEAGHSFYVDLEGEVTPRARWGVAALGRLTLVAGR